MSTYTILLQEVEALAVSAANAETLMQSVADRIHSVMARYNCVKFFVVDKADAHALLLGPYTGSFSPVARITFDQGLCGAAAATGKTLVVNDVAADPRYLSASDLVKSEIVVPIFARGKLAAEISVGSYFADTFAADADRNLVEACGAVIGKYLEKQPLN
jgi:L-methionine (R)-S-oxide reductase